MSSTILTLASLVPGLACCLAAAVIILMGPPSRLKVLGGTGALLAAAAQIGQLVVNLSPHDGIGWLWIPHVVSLLFVTGLVILAVAATSPPVRDPGQGKPGMPTGQPWPPGYPPAGPPPGYPPAGPPPGYPPSTPPADPSWGPDRGRPPR